MKKTFLLGVVILAIVALLFFDYRSKKEEFDRLKKEYEFSASFEQTVGLINNYFFEHGWFPDSLQQVDTIFNREVYIKNLDEVIETRYWFLIDPFSGKFYHYIPVMNEKYNKPGGYYLLSTGVDSKINNKGLNEGSLKLYDSASFNYLDFYFGQKDLLVREGSIEDWISEPFGMEVSMKWLAKRYDPTGKRALPRSVRFYGVIEDMNANHLLLKDIQSNLKAVCYLAPSVGEISTVSGDTVQVNGIYSKVSLGPDTTFNFLNCVLIKKK